MNTAARRDAGFSLIELMISMVLGVLVVGAAVAVFQGNQRSYQANEGLNRVQENARAIFELMSRDIRAAAGSACSNSSRPPEGRTQSSEEKAFLSTPVTGTDSEITLVSADDSGFRLSGATATTVTLASGQIDDAQDAFKANDLILLCNAYHTYVVTASGVTADTVTFSPALGQALFPATLNDDNRAQQATASLARYRSTRWFSQANGRGGNSLYVARNGGAAQEIADGVGNLAFTYLHRGATSYVTAADWSQGVIAIRASMQLKGQNIEGQVFQRDGAVLASIRRPPL